MDWGQIGAGAAYGAIGGFFGALAGYLLSLPFRRAKAATMIGTAFTAIGVALGINFAEPLLAPLAAKYAPGLAASVQSDLDRETDAALAEMRKNPLLAALLEKEPELEAKLRKEIAGILESADGNVVSARAQGAALGLRLSSEKLAYYLPRAREEDLDAFAAVIVAISDDLKTRDPEFCFTYFFNVLAISAMNREQVIAGLGQANFDEQQRVSVAAIKYAYAEIPEYDIAAAALTNERASAAMVAELGPDRVNLVSGMATPASREDAAAACGAVGLLYAEILNADNTADALRHLLRGNN